MEEWDLNSNKKCWDTVLKLQDTIDAVIDRKLKNQLGTMFEVLRSNMTIVNAVKAEL